MKGGPATQELLALAAETLARDVLPRLEGEARYSAAMVRSAIEIASREIAGGPSAIQADRAKDQALLALVSPLAEEAFPSRKDLQRSIQLNIRLGRFDREPVRSALLSRLAEQTLAALADVNPALAAMPALSTRGDE